MRARTVALVGALALGACNSILGIDDHGLAPTTAEGGADAGDSGVDSSLGMEGGGDANPGEGGLEGATPLTISNVSMVTGPDCVLSAVLTFDTSQPASATITLDVVGGDDAGAPLENPPVDPTVEAAHKANIVGLRASTTVAATITATAGSQTATTTAMYTAGVLPSFIPPVTVVATNPTQTQPGYTYLTLWQWSGEPAGISTTASSVVALDAAGRVVWYHLVNGSYPWDVKKLANGDLLFLDAYYFATEIDIMGNVVQTYTPTAMGLSGFSEEILPEANGKYLSISPQLRTSVPAFPGEGGVVGDLFSEFSPDAAVGKQWATLDMLDAGFTTEASFGSYWTSRLFPDAGPTNDWSHANSLFVDPTDDSIVASLRDLDWVIKFSRADGGVMWRLGNGGDFVMTSPDGGPTKDIFPGSQYAATLTPAGTILLWDGISDGTSRAAEYAVDPATGHSYIAWRYSDKARPFYSPFGGNAAMLANGNILVNDGYQLAKAGDAPGDDTNLKTVRLIEVTHATPAVQLAEFDIEPPLANPPSLFSGYTAYRAIRVPSLY